MTSNSRQSSSDANSTGVRLIEYNTKTTRPERRNLIWKTVFLNNFFTYSEWILRSVRLLVTIALQILDHSDQSAFLFLDILQLLLQLQDKTDVHGRVCGRACLRRWFIRLSFPVGWTIRPLLIPVDCFHSRVGRRRGSRGSHGAVTEILQKEIRSRI